MDLVFTEFLIGPESQRLRVFYRQNTRKNNKF